MWRLFDRCGESEVGIDGLVPLAEFRAGLHHGQGSEAALPNAHRVQTRRSGNTRTDCFKTRVRMLSPAITVCERVRRCAL